MIEKIAPIVLVAAMLLSGLTYTGPSDLDSSYAEIVAPAGISADTEVIEAMDLLIESLAANDLIARGKDAGFSLNSDFSYFTSPAGDSLMFIEIELRSAVGTAMYDSNTVDWELMRDIQYAVVDSNIFGLSEEDMATVKQHYYTPDDSSEDIDLDCGVNLHINETPFGYEAILYLRHNRVDIPDHFTQQWRVSYSWDEIYYDTRPN